jgi:GNAT superfamily N-acetyltransferase
MAAEPPAHDAVAIRVEDEVAPADVETILSGLRAANLRWIEPVREWERRDVGVVARRAGRMVAGATGQTAWAWLYIGRLWVAEELRGAGLGTRIVRRLESEAKARGCTGAWLDTFDFQAKPFYEKLGYRLFGELADFPPGHARHFLWRPL